VLPRAVVLKHPLSGTARCPLRFHFSADGAVGDQELAQMCLVEMSSAPARPTSNTQLSDMVEYKSEVYIYSFHHRASHIHINPRLSLLFSLYTRSQAILQHGVWSLVSCPGHFRELHFVQ